MLPEEFGFHFGKNVKILFTNITNGNQRVEDFSEFVTLRFVKEVKDFIATVEGVKFSEIRARFIK